MVVGCLMTYGPSREILLLCIVCVMMANSLGAAEVQLPEQIRKHLAAPDSATRDEAVEKLREWAFD